MNKTELRLMYKKETSCSVGDIVVDARHGKYGNVILDGYDLDDEWKEWIGDGSQITIPDADYLQWLEEKVMHLLS